VRKALEHEGEKAGKGDGKGRKTSK
jgi:hypothetical protein